MTLDGITYLKEEPIKANQAELEAEYLNYLKRSQPKKYKAMKPIEVQELCKLKAEAAIREAENLISTGEPDFVAWPRARRSIMGIESD